MAIFRKLHVSFWKDEYVENLTPQQKFFFLYLLTNDRATQCGIYELTLKQICFDTGLEMQEILKHLEKFEQDDKLLYNAETKEIALKNWARYNDSTSPKVKSCIKRELQKVKDKGMILYLYSSDTVLNQFSMCIGSQSQEEEDKEEDIDKDKEEDKDHSKFFPDKSLMSIDLDASDFDLTKVYIEVTTKAPIDPLEIERMWKGFKIQYFTGKQGYKDWDDIKNHFRDWLKQSILKNTKNNASSQTGTRKLSKHEAGIAGAFDDLENDLKQRGIPNM